ncbi:MAG: hypothetical protein ABIL11_13835 [Chloroflexota bacterium]
MRRFLIFVLALLTSTALSASLAACRQVPEGGSPSLRVSPSSSPIPALSEAEGSTNTPKPTETPIPTPTLTPTPTTEALLPQEEIEELASQLTPLICRPDYCIRPVDKDNSSSIFLVSTGIIERLAITDELGNEIAGVDVLHTVTRNKEDQPVVVKVIVQGWTKDNPNLNAYWWTYRRLFEGAEDEKRLPKTVLPLEYIRQMFAKGLVFKSQLELEPLGDDWLGVVPDRDPEVLFVNLLLAQTANTEKMKVFVLSQGVEGADNDFLIATAFLSSEGAQQTPLP